MNSPLSFLSVAVCAGALVSNTSRAATIDQYGNRRNTDIDMMGYQYENAKRWNSTPAAPQIDMSAFNNYQSGNTISQERLNAMERQNQLARQMDANRESSRLAAMNRELDEREARQARAQAAAAPIIAAHARHEVLVKSGDATACTARALELLTGKSVVDGKTDNYYKQPEDAWQPIKMMKGSNGLNLVWTHALAWLENNDPTKAIGRNGREPGNGDFFAVSAAWRAEHSEASAHARLNLVLCAYLTPAMGGDGPAISAQFKKRELQNIVAGALHTLATTPPSAEGTAPTLDAATAALARRAQRDGTAPLLLSPAAAQLVEEALQNPGKNPLGSYWRDKVGAAPAEAGSAPPPLKIDLRALPTFFAAAQLDAWQVITNKFPLLQQPTAAPLPAGFEDPNSRVLLLGLINQALDDELERRKTDRGRYGLNEADDLLLAVQRRFAEYNLRPLSLRPPGQLDAWRAHMGAFQSHPKALAPWIVLDDREHSPWAVRGIEAALPLLGEDPEEPQEFVWPALDRLARNYSPLLKTPAARLAGAWGLVYAKGGRPLTSQEKGLLQFLIGNNGPTGLTLRQRARRVQLLWLGGLGNPGLEVSAIALGRTALEQNDPLGLDFIDLGLAMRVARFAAAPQTDPVEIAATLPLLHEVAARFAARDRNPEPRSNPSITIPWLIDRCRRLDGKYFPALASAPPPALPNASAYEPYDRAAIDAFGTAAIRRPSDLASIRALSQQADQKLLRSLAGFTFPNVGHDPRVYLRFAMREQAEALAADLLALPHTPAAEEDDLARQAWLHAAERFDGSYGWATRLIGRDLAVGGLATRTLLLLSEGKDPDYENQSPAILATLKAKLPAALPATVVLDQLAAIAINPKKSPDLRRSAAVGLASATEAVFHDATDSIGSLAWRRHALGLLARHAEQLVIETPGWPENLVPHAPKLLAARVAWELSRLDAPALTPAERAAPLVKSLGPLAALLAFITNDDLKPGIYVEAGIRRQMMLEPDPDFAPGLLRALGAVPDQEPLIARYLKGETPSSPAEWTKLAAGRRWWSDGQ